MRYKISWVHYDEYHEKLMDSWDGAERLQNFLLNQGFCSLIEEVKVP